MEAIQLAKEAAKAEKQASYLFDVGETQIRLTEELSEVCKDYCLVTWVEALNLAGFLADSELKQLEKVYFHPEIHEVPVALQPPSVIAPESSEQPLPTQAALTLSKAVKIPSQVGDQGQGVGGAKDKGNDKEAKLPAKAKDVAKAKTQEIEAMNKETDPKAKDVPPSKPSQKEDPPKAKKQLLRFILQLLLLFRLLFLFPQ